MSRTVSFESYRVWLMSLSLNSKLSKYTLLYRRVGLSFLHRPWLSTPNLAIIFVRDHTIQYTYALVYIWHCRVVYKHRHVYMVNTGNSTVLSVVNFRANGLALVQMTLPWSSLTGGLGIWVLVVFCVVSAWLVSYHLCPFSLCNIPIRSKVWKKKKSFLLLRKQNWEVLGSDIAIGEIVLQ